MNNNNTMDITCATCASRKMSVFRKLHGEELDLLDQAKGCQLFKKNQTIYTQGSHSNGLYCINSGKVKIYKRAANGKEQIIGFAKNGDIIGYRDLLAGEPYDASVDAIEDSMVCYLPKSSILNMMQKNPSLGMKFMGLLCDHLKNSHDRVIDMSYKTVRERLAQTLLLLKETFGYEEDNETLNIKLSRKDLANYIGTASESIIRLLYEFKDEGMIELEGQKILFKDTQAIVTSTGIYK